MEDHVELSHWRTRDGDEVDLVVERDDGRIVAFEVKATTHIKDSDLKSMRTLRAMTSSSFVGGFLLYTGERSYTVEEGINVVPISRLWTPMKPIVQDGHTVREMTDPEYLQYQADQTEWKTRQKAEDNDKTAKDAAKLRARTKLMALGLTNDEISALGD